MPGPAAKPDRNYSVAVRVNGKTVDSLYKCIQHITVEEDLDVGSSFSIELQACRNDDGSWPYLEDANLAPWNRITVHVVFPKKNAETVIDGYIAEISVSTMTAENAVTVEIRGVDAAYHMNLEDKRRIYIGKTYEAIAEEVLEHYKFEARIDKSGEQSGAKPHAVAQRGTDYAFLRELARRKGYEFFVHGGSAFFRPPKLDGEPQKLIAVNFGAESNCTQFRVEADGTAPTAARIMFVDPMTGKVTESKADKSGLALLGKRSLDTLRGAVGVPQKLQIGRRLGCLDPKLADDLATGMLRRNAWWVVATGRLNGLRYGHVLRSRKLVTIKGVGDSYNGNYYVRKVRHELTMRTYDMHFEAVRNALGKLGSERFEGELPDSLAPPALRAGFDTDTVRVAEGGPRVLPA